jgi:hypothetical protein
MLLKKLDVPTTIAVETNWFFCEKTSAEQQSEDIMNSKHELVCIGKGIVSSSAALVVSGLLFLSGNSMAAPAPITMNDGGSSATINPNSSAGMNNWSVNGQNQLNQQWFWYQTDGGIAKPINTISTANIVTYNGSPGNINEVVATYQNAQLTLTIDYYLTGGGVGSGNADLAENISVVNNTGSALNFNFYQYSDFNLLGSGANDIVQIYGNPGNFNYAEQTSGGTAIGEVVVAPNANRGEAAMVGQTLNELNTTPNLQLNNNTLAGPGDVTWALQWGTTIGAGQEYDISKDKNLSIQIVPEPSTLAFIALGLGAWGLARRRQSS